MKSANSLPGVFVSLLAAALWGATPLLAQTATTATILGTVQDSTGAVVARAVADLVDTATIRSRSTATNDVGQYLFPNVPPGAYTVSVSMTGFRKAVVQDLQVDVAKSYTVNVSLELGAVAETVYCRYDVKGRPAAEHEDEN